MIALTRGGRTPRGLAAVLAAAAEVQGFLDYCRERRISWANWSLSNTGESYSAITPDCRKLSGWTDGDLTLSGRLVFQALGE